MSRRPAKRSNCARPEAAQTAPPALPTSTRPASVRAIPFPLDRDQRRGVGPRRVTSRDSSKLDRWIEGCLVASVASSMLSIAISGLALGAALALWSLRCARARALVLELPPFIRVAALFVAAVGVSIALSENPGHSVHHGTKLLRYLTVPLIYTFVSVRIAWRTLAALLTILTLSAAYGVAQYFWLLEVDLLHRIDGFMGDWMTFSGQLMLGTIALFSVLVGDPDAIRDLANRRLRWILRGVLVLFLFALLLSQTRSAWLGALAGGFTCILWLRRRWLMPAILVLLSTLVVLPESYRERLATGFDIRDTTTRDRIELLELGTRIVVDHPWFGIGPDMVPVVAPQYRRGAERPPTLYCHLHNSALNVAAEMGLLALAAWLALWAFIFRDLYQIVQQGPFVRSSRPLAIAAVCAMVGFLTSGLLEHNFGDTEVLVPLLFLVITPYLFHFRERPRRGLAPLVSFEAFASTARAKAHGLARTRERTDR